jgi:hypothetical protein
MVTCPSGSWLIRTRMGKGRGRKACPRVGGGAMPGRSSSSPGRGNPSRTIEQLSRSSSRPTAPRRGSGRCAEMSQEEGRIESVRLPPRRETDRPGRETVTGFRPLPPVGHGLHAPLPIRADMAVPYSPVPVTTGVDKNASERHRGAILHGADGKCHNKPRLAKYTVSAVAHEAPPQDSWAIMPFPVKGFPCERREF